MPRVTGVSYDKIKLSNISRTVNRWLNRVLQSAEINSEQIWSN